MNKASKHTKDMISLAIYALMHRMPYEEITVKQICQKADVSRMSFYRYYNQKDDVFVDYCDERFEEFYNYYSQRLDMSKQDFVIALFSFFKKYSRQLLTLKKAGKADLLMDQLNNYVRYTIMNFKSEYTENKKNNPLVAPFLAGGVFNVLMNWLDSGMKESPEDMCKLLFDIFK